MCANFTFFFFKQKTAYDMRISDWSSDVCSSDLVPWAMVFPHGGDLPRHPSQLYEAFLEGLVLFVVLAILAYRPGMRARVGFLTGVFLEIGSASCRERGCPYV